MHAVFNSLIGVAQNTDKMHIFVEPKFQTEIEILNSTCLISKKLNAKIVSVLIFPISIKLLMLLATVRAKRLQCDYA